MSHNLCWIRRDLRLHDHAALSAALNDGETTVVFIFDKYILDKLTDKNDLRVTFIYQSLQEIEASLQKKGSSLIVRYGSPENVLKDLVKDLKITKVFFNRDYEPYAKKRDGEVQTMLKSLGVESHSFKDSVFFETHELQTGAGGPYKVFTPYKNKWLDEFNKNGRVAPDYKINFKNLRKFENPKNILIHDWYKEIKFKETPPLLTGGTKSALKRLKAFDEHIENYSEARNFPATPGTSLLSVYIRHGNLSVRDLIRAGIENESPGSKTWVSEIIWRDFYQMILDAYPHVEHHAFKPEYDKIKFPGKSEHLEAWKNGETGYPIIDAAMRCLNQTGMMHNRLRMIVASFFCKILLHHWSEGENYFAEKLLDYDLAANNGGWQWSSSSGCDAQPYFRIFNPYAQSKKFDPEGEFIRKWCPELKDLSPKEIHRPPNVKPVVSYELNRLKCLQIYSVVKKK